MKKWLPLFFLNVILVLLTTGCGGPAVTPTEAPALIPDSPIANTIPDTASTPTFTVAPASQVEKILLIYDDDGSRDGTAALLYLLGQPQISLLAVNISYGEAHPQVYIQHIGRILDDLGYQHIPLGAGQDAPLANGTPFPDWLRQLSDNFWDYPLQNADKTYPVQNAPELMVAAINQASEPVAIFMSGTFTTLAQALRLDPDIREKISTVYIMGGSVYVPGNITNLIPDSTNKVSEWNIYADPQAAKEVFESGLDMVLVPLDATNKVIFHSGDILPWHDGNERGSLSADLYDIMFNDYGFESAEIFDLGAAVIMVKPDTCVLEPLHLDVITDDGINSGQTIVVPDQAPNFRVCLDPNADLIMQALNDSFSSADNSLETPPIDPLIGTWTGSAFNNDFELLVSITIEDACQLGQMCGHFEITNGSCSASLTWVGMEGDLYQFRAGDKTDGCGEGIDYLQPLPDGTIMYISRGDYGETKGSLHKEP